MKKFILIMVTSCMTIIVTAQLKINLILNSAPPAQLSEWGNRREVLTAVVTGLPGLAVNVLIKTEIKTLDGTVIATTDLAKAPTFNIGSANTIFTAAEVMPLESMIFFGKYKSSLLRTGKLPSDNYSLCVQLVRPVDFTPASEPSCKNFYLASIQLPTLMKPYDGEILNANAAQTAITFRWTPLLPRPARLGKYRIQVFEVLQKQSPVQAMRSNQPVLDQEVVGTTQYIWRPQLAFNIIQDGNCEEKEFQDRSLVNTDETGSVANSKSNQETDPNNTKRIKCIPQFIWTVQTLDEQGLPVAQTDGSGEGRSEPILFYVDTNKNKPSSNSSKKKGPIKVIKDTTGGSGG